MREQIYPATPYVMIVLHVALCNFKLFYKPGKLLLLYTPVRLSIFN